MPERHQVEPVDKVKAAIVRVLTGKRLKRLPIYEAVIPQFFKKKNYRLMIEELFEAGQLYADSRTMKTPGRLNEDTVLSAEPISR